MPTTSGWGGKWEPVGQCGVIGINAAVGATVGFAIQQSARMLGGQGAGFISGEWRAYVAARENRWGWPSG
jgi:hypothetical protein